MIKCILLAGPRLLGCAPAATLLAASALAIGAYAITNRRPSSGAFAAPWEGVDFSKTLTVTLHSDGVMLWWWRPNAPSASFGSWSIGLLVAPGATVFPKYLPFQHGRGYPGWVGYSPSCTVWVAYWLLAAVLGLYPATRLVLLLVRRRRQEGPTCEHCGYNLTGNVSGVCPECGMLAKPAPSI